VSPGRVKVRLEACVEEETICVTKLFVAFAKYRRPVCEDPIPSVRFVEEALVVERLPEVRFVIVVVARVDVPVTEREAIVEVEV
jgi:hypothetical protein